eukprot:TRINITY_DN51539_c1_g1_i1.p1 TRINITY_DN51539_c1_g1~~TRINITY_DN51539_c1_g1_i1.p1  ORF type:complete len:202 (-),score=69.12 TRINITY_DN51539_c1_g1_i1:65-670(-)
MVREGGRWRRTTRLERQLIRDEQRRRAAAGEAMAATNAAMGEAGEYTEVEVLPLEKEESGAMRQPSCLAVEGCKSEEGAKEEEGGDEREEDEEYEEEEEVNEQTKASENGDMDGGDGVEEIDEAVAVQSYGVECYSGDDDIGGGGGLTIHEAGGKMSESDSDGKVAKDGERLGVQDELKKLLRGIRSGRASTAPLKLESEA